METLFDVQNQPLCIEKVRDNFIDFQLHNPHAKSEVLVIYLTSFWSGMLEGGKNPQDVVIERHGAIEMTVQSKKPKPVAMVKWLSKKGVIENTGEAPASY